MFRSMMCLVLAMSGTSALLGWISPVPASGARALSLQQIESLVQSVVAEASNLRPAQWNSVDLLAGPTTGKSAVSVFPSSTFLAAEPTRKQAVPDRAGRVGLRTDFHFRIDPHGRPFATDAWVRQIALAQDPNAIAIQVTRPGEGLPMTPSQRQCVRSLISELSTLSTISYGNAFDAPSPW